MAGKSLLHYFKPKPSTSTVVVVEEEQEEEEEEERPPMNETIELEEEPEETQSTSRPVVRRSTRASACKAREAWNEPEDDTTSSDDDDDFVQKTRKRPRNSGLKRNSSGRQTTLSKNGTLISKKTKEKNNNSKKKVKLDPERQAFLRSGVPDVIEKAKKKSLENGGSSSKTKNSDVDVDEKEPKRKQLDAETLAFLQSGVPESVLKAQLNVDKRKEEDDFLTPMGFFPKTSHVYIDDVSDDTITTEEDNTKEPAPICFNINPECTESLDEKLSLPSNNGSSSEPQQDFNCYSSHSQESENISKPVGLCCGENPIRVSSHENIVVKTRLRRSDCKKEKDVNKQNENDRRPWIDQMKVTTVKNLVVDNNALETFTRWLKQWKLDIKDDGGTSRKHEQKKKRGDSDSDFVTSDEGDSEMKKKSVLLTGPSGCGKTASVYVVAKHYDFEVVEVNFSSRRPGKEVLQRVEEAVLSHRLKSSHNCLLLFKDIDLLHPEEDEGFCSAVAQLITTAVRPIVMTSSLPCYYLIDSKLDRKDPLRISFSLPKPGEIVDKILKPILESTKSIMESDSGDQVDRWLDSIVRHSGCDIRQCINQLQLLLSTASADVTCLSNLDIHLYSSPFQTHLVDLNFPRQSFLPFPNKSKQDSQLHDVDDDDDEFNLSMSARKKRCISQLDSLGDCLELFSDLDGISRISSSLPTRNVNIFGDIEEASWHWSHVSGMRSTYFTRLAMCLESQKRNENSTRGGSATIKTKIDPRCVKELVLESDVEIDKWMEIDGMNGEIGEYCDRGMTSGTDWESCAAVRTIVKNNVLGSAIGRVQKRNGRMASYFNRLDVRLVAKIQNSFGFQKQLDSVKLYS